MTYDNTDCRIMAAVQKDLPVKPRPYQELAQTLAISELEVVQRLKALQHQGIIRRMGAVLRHQKAGYTVNAMVAWKILRPEADQAGEFMASFSAVSHCYYREVPEEFPYPLFTMIHAQTEEQLQQILTAISEQLGVDDYLVLKTVRELKKTSRQYF